MDVIWQTIEDEAEITTFFGNGRGIDGFASMPVSA